MDLEQELLQEGVSRAILAEAAAFRKAHPAGNMQYSMLSCCNLGS